MESRLLSRGASRAIALLFGATPLPALAATTPGGYGPVWALPFAALLLSIALAPLLLPSIWHRHHGKIALAWAAAMLLPHTLAFGAAATLHLALHSLLDEYLPFVLLLAALYTVSGGIALRGNLHGSAARNTALLALGALAASAMGTTGAAMLLVRPLIHANDRRRRSAHVMVFFIFIVANAGGALTPLGDPPLFLGFLRGVDFFWTLRHLAAPTALLCAMLLALFYALDSWFWRQPDQLKAADPTPDGPLQLLGRWNLLWLLAVVGIVLLSGNWRPPGGVERFGVTLRWAALARDGALLAVLLASLATTPREARRLNHFHWGPMLEVAKLFLGIFLTIIPVIEMLRAGTAGAFAPLVRMTSDAHGAPIAAAYFWLTGALSSVLDNAPTYLVFFNLAGGEPARLMQEVSVLGAISAGSVYLGAMTYVGNAPNLMVKAIAEHRGVDMPSFFGYIGWSLAVLLPCLLLVQALFF
jgi:Na+/H+ antiporter NhaD/arsenite permease-like protein